MALSAVVFVFLLCRVCIEEPHRPAAPSRRQTRRDSFARRDHQRGVAISTGVTARSLRAPGFVCSTSVFICCDTTRLPNSSVRRTKGNEAYAFHPMFMRLNPVKENKGEHPAPRKKPWGKNGVNSAQKNTATHAPGDNISRYPPIRSNFAAASEISPSAP